MSDDSQPDDFFSAAADRELSTTPLEPSGIAQFVEHDRCPRYIKQRVAPAEEPNAREWREAFGVMNVALLGKGREFEANQIEALAAGATTIIGPDIDDPSIASVPDIDIDETWADSARGCTEQLAGAVQQASKLTSNDDITPYVLLYQAPLDGTFNDQAVYGDADCIVLAPADAVSPSEMVPLGSSPATDETTLTNSTTSHVNNTSSSAPAPHADIPRSDTFHPEADVVARVIDIKSASEQQPAHRVQVALYCALLEETLAEGPPTPSCHIEASVLTQQTATASGDRLDPFALSTFRRAEWELFVTQLLAEDGSIDEALDENLEDLPYSLDQVCDNCAFSEACATRAVEAPTEPTSLALLGLDAGVQRALQDCGITSIRELSTLQPRLEDPRPTDDPPVCDLPLKQRRALEEALPGSISETVQRAQALRGAIDPDYPTEPRPQAIPGKDWVSLPDDRCPGWSNIEGADPGELIHVALVVRPDTAINRIATLGGCVYADAHDEYLTIGEVIDAVPDDPSLADTAERELFERFLVQLFEAIETVARALGDPEKSVIHYYTYSEHEKTTLAEGLDRHTETVEHAAALRSLLSLHSDGHTGVDQDMISAIQPILNDHFALQYPSQGLLAVTEQFIPTWTIEAFDPLDARPDDPPLRAIFRERFLNDRVPYLKADPGIRLHLAHGPLGEGPAAEAADTTADAPSPDGWYPIRKRAGTQFPIEYIWAATPKRPDDTTPRLTPDVVDEWVLDDEHRPLYRQEINRFYYRTASKNEPIQRADLEYLLERLSYALLRLVEAIPYKDTYHPKESIDATNLTRFDLPVTRLPEAARDYLHIEFGTRQEAILEHYRHSLRERARSGRSILFRCTDYDRTDDGALTITGELAYDALFDHSDTASQVARQARIQSSDGPGGGSWRVLTRVTDQPRPTPTEPPTAEQALTTDDSPSPRDYTEADIEDPSHLQYSPPVLVDNLDHQTGTIELTAFPHRFQRNGSSFRVNHCGWACPTGNNLETPDAPPEDRPGYVAGRPPVWIDTDDLFVLDPMVDDFGAPKADRALIPDTVKHNTLWRQLRAIHHHDQQQAAMVCAPGEIEGFLDRLTDAEECLTPNARQRTFIRAVDRAIVPLQGPPGTGKTSGAIAPALLARAHAQKKHSNSFVGPVVAPSHEAVDAVLDSVVNCLDNWREATNSLSSLELVRILPTTPPSAQERADATTTNVDVTYCNYHSDEDTETLRKLTRDHIENQHTPDGNPSQCLLFMTPATLYRTLGIVAETLTAIDGTSAPAAMRHEPGLADVVCIDEASMLDIPNLLLAGSVLKPTGQTLLVGDHRQLTTVTETDWTDTLRKPLETTQAYRSALDYIRWLTTKTPHPSQHQPATTDSDSIQTTLTESTPPDNESPPPRGDDDGA